MNNQLINLIKSFLEESQESYNKDNKVDKYKYIEITRYLSLFKNEFDLEEKHKHLFRYINQPIRKVEKDLFEKEISNDNLQEWNFLRMQNYLIGVKDWINK
jgi:hypothetical protein